MTISDNLVPFTSILRQDMIDTAEMRRVWSEENMIRSWMAVEKPLPKSRRKMGIIPMAAARQIIAKLWPEHLPLQDVKKHAAATGVRWSPSWLMWRGRQNLPQPPVPATPGGHGGGRSGGLGSPFQQHNAKQGEPGGQ